MVYDRSMRNFVETSVELPVTPEFIERRIHLIRGQKVLLGQSLADLYSVSTKILIQAVKRNKDRFPPDFMFQLTMDEFKNLKSQFVTSSWGGVRKLPYAFTELGVAMLSSVLNSDRAIQMNIFIMRAFVKLRELLATDKELAEKIALLERAQKLQRKDITDIIVVINKLVKDTRKLLKAHKLRKSAIGFEV
jgi:hypothetical protein